MNFRILPIANDDLLNGYHFYEQQEKGIGSYFLDSLFSDIDSLLVYHGVHSVFFNKYYRLLSKRFPFAIYYTPSTTRLKMKILLFMPCLIAVKNPHG